MDINHPDLSFTIERDAVTNRCIKRHSTGAVEACTDTEYLLGLILMKLDGLAPLASEAEPVSPIAPAKEELSKPKHKGGN